MSSPIALPSSLPRLTRLARQTSSKGTTADRVAALLADYIRRHRLPAGTPLPSEVQSSLRLGVSRGVVREAYRSLSQAGTVDIANGRSPRVGALSNRSVLQLAQHALWTRQASVEQILDLRQTIETHAAELAAANRTEADVAALSRAVAAMRAAADRVDRWAAADIQFHEILGRATGNPLFWLLSSALREAMGTSIRVSFAGRSSQAEHNRVLATHARLVEAIAAGRAREARRLMVRHFDEARLAVRRDTAREAEGIERRRAQPRRPGVRR
jgi:GntR family transcriptional repressor for pyruvate dehydrogenase complex